MASHQPLNDGRHVCADDTKLMMVRSELLRYGFRLWQLAGAVIKIEPDGECLQALVVSTTRHRSDRGRVDAAAQEDAHRHIAHQVSRNGFSEQAAGGLRSGGDVIVHRPDVFDGPVSRGDDAVPVKPEVVARQQAAHAMEQSARP